MSFLLFLTFLGVTALLLGLAAWLLRGPRAGGPLPGDLSALEDLGRRHVTYLPQIQQALAESDLVYLASLSHPALARRVRKERNRIALNYLHALRTDFQKLLTVARVIAVLSPQLTAIHEWDRVRLTLQFAVRYQILRLALFSGMNRLPQIRNLNQMVSILSVRMESAIRELGERALQVPN